MPFAQLAQHLQKTNILFWKNPPATWKETSALLTGNLVLLTFCRYPSFSFNNLHVHLICAIIFFFLGYFTSLVILAARGTSNIVEESQNLAHIIVLTWIVSLVLFLPNIFPPIRWYVILGDNWRVAFLHSFVAVLLLATNTIRTTNNSYQNIFLWSLFLVTINTVFFYLFVLDISTDDFLDRYSPDMIKLLNNKEEYLS